MEVLFSFTIQGTIRRVGWRGKPLIDVILKELLATEGSLRDPSLRSG